MSGPILFIPEHIESCAHQMLTQADGLEHQAYMLLAAARSMDWYGNSRDAFLADLEGMVHQMITAAEEIRTLAWRAVRTAENVQETDTFYTREYSLMIFNGLAERALS